MLTTNPGLTPYITPAVLLAGGFGISWGTFPKAGVSQADQVAAMTDVCKMATSEMDSLANQTLRATLSTETEFGPDLRLTVLPNGWLRFVLSRWPILSLVSAQYSMAGANPPSYSAIPSTALLVEGSPLPPTGTIVPGGTAGPVAALIAPGYVSWANGRKGYLVQVTYVSGFPSCGIDATAAAGATTLHVDDITGWFITGVGGARGTIYDPPWREEVLVTGITPDTVGATSGPGTLTLATALQFGHHPAVGGTTVMDQRILLSAMPQSLVLAAHYMCVHFGLIRGASAAVIGGQRGNMLSATAGIKGVMDWYAQAELLITRYARTY